MAASNLHDFILDHHSFDEAPQIALHDSFLRLDQQFLTLAREQNMCERAWRLQCLAGVSDPQTF